MYRNEGHLWCAGGSADKDNSSWTDINFAICVKHQLVSSSAIGSDDTPYRGEHGEHGKPPIYPGKDYIILSFSYQ